MQTSPWLESARLSNFDREKDTQCFQLEPPLFCLSLRHYIKIDGCAKFAKLMYLADMDQFLPRIEVRLCKLDPGLKAPPGFKI